MIKKEQVAGYLLQQALGKETPATDNFAVQRYTKKPSQIPLLILDLLNYLKLRRISAAVLDWHEFWIIFTMDDYVITMRPVERDSSSEIEKACPSEPEPHRVIRKLKKFFEKHNFIYTGLRNSQSMFEFRTDNVIFTLEKEKFTKKGGIK